MTVRAVERETFHFPLLREMGEWGTGGWKTTITLFLSECSTHVSAFSMSHSSGWSASVSSGSR